MEAEHANVSGHFCYYCATLSPPIRAPHTVVACPKRLRANQPEFTAAAFGKVVRKVQQVRFAQSATPPLPAPPLVAPLLLPLLHCPSSLPLLHCPSSRRSHPLAFACVCQVRESHEAQLENVLQVAPRAESKEALLRIAGAINVLQKLSGSPPPPPPPPPMSGRREAFWQLEGRRL